MLNRNALGAVLLGFAPLAATLAVQSRNVLAKCDTPAYSLFSNNEIYTPPKGRAIYPRVAELQDSTLLVTSSMFGSYPGVPAFFPVFASKDGGLNWNWISNITDQVNGWGMPAQPAIMELLEPLGGYGVGTVLAAGNS